MIAEVVDLLVGRHFVFDALPVTWVEIIIVMDVLMLVVILETAIKPRLVMFIVPEVVSEMVTGVVLCGLMLPRGLLEDLFVPLALLGLVVMRSVGFLLGLVIMLLRIRVVLGLFLLVLCSLLILSMLLLSLTLLLLLGLLELQICRIEVPQSRDRGIKTVFGHLGMVVIVEMLIKMLCVEVHLAGGVRFCGLVVSDFAIAGARALALGVHFRGL